MNLGKNESSTLRVLESVSEFSFKHRGLMAILFLGVVVFAGQRLFSINFSSDASSLVGGNDEDSRQTLKRLKHFTAMDDLALILSCDDPEENLGQAREELIDALHRSQQFSWVRGGLSTQEQRDVAHYFMSHRFALADVLPQNNDALKVALETAKTQLTSPAATLLKDHIRRDPIGLLAQALKTLSTAPGLEHLSADVAAFHSSQTNAYLLLSHPQGEPFNAADASKTMGVIKKAERDLRIKYPSLHIAAIGAHRFANDAQKIVQRDVRLSIAGTLFAVTILFLVVFRSLRLVVVAQAPIIFGAAVGIITLSFHSPDVHPIVLAFGGASLGLSVDYTLHFASALGPQHNSAQERWLHSLHNLGLPLFWAMLTTVGALLIVAQAQTLALQQMAILAAAAIFGSFVGNLILLPPLAPWFSAKLNNRSPKFFDKIANNAARGGPLRWTILGILFIVGAALSQNIEVQSDLRRLDTRTQEALTDEAFFNRAFGDPQNTSLVIAQGKTLNAALEHAHNIKGILNQDDIHTVLSASSWLAPQSEIDARQKQICFNSFATRLDELALSLGFVSDAFRPFAQDLEQFCKQSQTPPEEQLAQLQTASKLFGKPLFLKVPQGYEVSVVVGAHFPNETQTRIIAAGGKIIDRMSLQNNIFRRITQDLPRLAGGGLLLVLVVLLLAYRNMFQAIRASAPALVGASMTLASMTLMGESMNLLNICVFPLLAGLAIDYGLVCHPPKPATNFGERLFTVSIAAATTMAGFGTLSLARYEGIATIGKAVLLGVFSAWLVSFIVPTSKASHQ